MKLTHLPRELLDGIVSGELDMRAVLMLRRAHVRVHDNGHAAQRTIAKAWKRVSATRWLQNYYYVAGPEKIRHLIAQGADVNVRQDFPSSGATVLHWAAAVGDLAVMDVLIEAGADVNAGTYVTSHESSETPLKWACIYGRDAAVRRLLDAGAIPKLGDIRHECVHPNIFSMLLDAGADPNAVVNGQTALHCYCKKKPCQSPSGIVNFLLANGADHTIRDVYGRTPAYYAVRWNPDARDSLRAAGAKIPRYFIHVCAIM